MPSPVEVPLSLTIAPPALGVTARPPAMVPGGTAWQIRLLGDLRAHRGGQVIAHFRTHKTGSLLGYLACYPHRPHPREVLIDLLWPAADPAAGRGSLSVALSSLRQQLEPPGTTRGAVLIAERSFIQLGPAAVDTDVAAFERCLRSARLAHSSEDRAVWLERSVERYVGELLPGHYYDWVLAARRRLEDAFIDAVRVLARHREARGDLTGAIDLAHRALHVDPLDEESHRLLIRLYAAARRPAAARRQHRELERLLALG
jgi:DNA-binding SARP family transcriptional activator